MDNFVETKIFNPDLSNNLSTSVRIFDSMHLLTYRENSWIAELFLTLVSSL